MRKINGQQKTAQDLAGRVFTIKLDKEIDLLLQQARQMADHKRFIFQGDQENGSFEGKGLKGEYSVAEDYLSLRILQKPALSTWSSVEDKIKDLFAGPSAKDLIKQKIKEKQRQLRAQKR